MANNVRTIFDDTRTKTKGGGTRITEQAHANNLDINQIVARAKKTGMLRQTLAVAKYGDFSNVHDYFSAQNFLMEAGREFMALPAKVRGFFHNNPGKMLEFLADEKNRDKAIELGLLEKNEKMPETKPAISENTPQPGNPNP